jgi:adenylyltransferase/sulfurtransferase
MNPDSSSPFSESEWLRYTRHIQLPQIGAAGQLKLKQARVLIVGAGGLGSPVSLYLAAAGVGHITLVDGDIVDTTNLQRQILFTQQDVGQSKAMAGQTRLSALNPDIEVTAITEHFTLHNGAQWVEQADLVLDCTDNFATRYLINDLCAYFKKPWVFASIHQFSGQCALFTPGQGHACFRCLFPESPTNIADCNAAGVLGVLPGMLGIFQANEALKYLAGLPTPLNNTLLLIEALDLTFRKIKLAQNKDCVVCQQHLAPSELTEFYQFECASETCSPQEITTSEFESLKNNENIRLLDVRTVAERNAFHIGGQHIPLSELEHAYHSLENTKTIVCYCQSGMRSLKAAQLLNQLGYDAKSLRGGLAALLKKTHSVS